MIKHTGYHPEINKFLDELEEIKQRSQGQAALHSSATYPNETDHEREVRQACVQAYANVATFCQVRLMQLKIYRPEGDQSKIS